MGNKLPKPLHKYGYTRAQVEGIAKNVGVTMERFWGAFGINTCALDKELGTIYYPCDVERALHMLNRPGGKYHPWD